MVSSPYKDEKDWLVTLLHFHPDCPEDDADEAHTLGYLLAYSDLTNTRCLALIGDPEGGLYEILFSFDSARNRAGFLSFIMSNENLGQEFIDGMSIPSSGEIERALPVATVIPPSVLQYANSIAQLIEEEVPRNPKNRIN